MFIKLTKNQRLQATRLLVPECASQLQTGTEIEPDQFWLSDWYIIDHEYPNQPVTCGQQYPYSIQVMYNHEWYEIDVISNRCFKNIMEVR